MAGFGMFYHKFEMSEKINNNDSKKISNIITIPITIITI